MSKDINLNPLSNEADYYFENGLMVMTAAYHLKRGYCCSNGCRHCPYPKNNTSKNEATKPE